MAFISLFEVIGPNMVGPSSSHTAGAVSMALLARKLFPAEIKKSSLRCMVLLQKHIGDMERIEHCLGELWDLRQMI